MKGNFYHHGALRSELLDAAESLLATIGGRSLTLRELARAAGVSHAAPYHHFAGRDDLMAAVAERGFANLNAAMACATDEPRPRERLLSLCEIYVDFACERPARFRLMFGPLLTRKSEFPALEHEANGALSALMHACADFSPKQGLSLALAGWSISHGLAHLLIDRAFDNLPIETPPRTLLARQMATMLVGEKSKGA